MRSRTGCLTCRQRKLKCDETKPICGQCCKASRDCVPSSGIVFRHQHNASMNGDDASDENTLKGFYAYKNTFDDENVWLDVPKHVTFINTSNPYLDPPTPEFDTMSTTSLDSQIPFEALLSASWPGSSSIHTMTSTPSSTGPDLPPLVSTSAPLTLRHLESKMISSLAKASMLQSPPISAAGDPVSPSLSLCNQHLPSFYHPSPVASTPPPPSIDPRLSTPFEPDHMPRSNSSQSNMGNVTDQDHEIAFLLRWFSEGPGYWMDLFDLGTYFSSYIPVKAREDPLLKYAAVAYAAKSLARVQGRKPVVGGNATRQARMEMCLEDQSVDWYHKATQYYNIAVSLLLQALKGEAAAASDSDSDCESTRNNNQPRYLSDGHVAKRRRTRSNSPFKSNTDELLAASAILCVYEFLDASVVEWEKHLNGAKSLLAMAQGRMTPLQMPSPGSTNVLNNLGFISKARRAAFWNIARQDMLAAFINKTRTRLDAEDLTLWKEAGLLVDETGSIIPNNTTDTDYPEEDEVIKEDCICNTLVWLMAKLVNFLAISDDLPTELGGSWTVPQRTLIDYWCHLRQQFQIWYDSLPATFQPCTRMDSSRTPRKSSERINETLFPEVWYSMPMCASTMQYYHMSQIQLLMNKPQESTRGRTNVFAQLTSCQSVLAASQVHSREIIGISSARSDDAVRIHSVQPLYTAGQCLSAPGEQQVVLDLLRSIESDIGWATDYRAKQLLEQWQWDKQEELHDTWTHELVVPTHQHKTVR